MQSPRRINDPANSIAVLVAIVLSVLLLLGQALFIVPAGKVAVVTTLGKVSGGSRLPGLNLKVPFIQSVYPFDVRTQVKPEEFATLTKDLQVIEATATVKYAVRPDEAGRIYRTIAGNDRDLPPHHSAVFAESAEVGLLPVRTGHHCHRMERHIRLGGANGCGRARQIRLRGSPWP